LRDAGKSNEIALNTKIGHEHSPTGNFVFFGVVQGKTYLLQSKWFKNQC